MVHCHKCGKSVGKDEDFCSGCGAKIKHEKKGHNKTSHYQWAWSKPKTKHQKSNNATIIIVVIIIVIAAIILMSMYGQQQHTNSFSGQTESLIDKIFG